MWIIPKKLRVLVRKELNLQSKMRLSMKIIPFTLKMRIMKQEQRLMLKSKAENSPEQLRLALPEQRSK